MSWRSESPFTVGFRAYVGFWFHCSPNPAYLRTRQRRAVHSLGLWAGRLSTGGRAATGGSEGCFTLAYPHRYVIIT
ncbi:hypothetical protein HV87_10800 [Pseudomonas aeruginosa]|nr:hypothetical protein HV87_10800 [Pseudomonas aeruginosa]